MSPDECRACGFDPGVDTVVVGDLVIAANFPSQNTLGANARGSAGWHYRRLRSEFAASLHTALATSSVPKATVKRRVWLKRIFRPGKRPYDAANLQGGGKAIVDVLVSRGLLVDDSPTWLEAYYHQEPGEADAICLRFEDIQNTVSVKEQP